MGLIILNICYFYYVWDYIIRVRYYPQPSGNAKFITHFSINSVYFFIYLSFSICYTYYILPLSELLIFSLRCSQLPILFYIYIIIERIAQLIYMQNMNFNRNLTLWKIQKYRSLNSPHISKYRVFLLPLLRCRMSRYDDRGNLQKRNMNWNYIGNISLENWR